MLHVVLVGAKTPGNVGAVARACRNFGVEHLHLVDPPSLSDEAWERARHAEDLLEGAARVGSFEEVAGSLDHLAAFTAIPAGNPKRHLRDPLDVRTLADRLREVEGDVGLVFGREDDGLRNEEILRCDTVATIPTDPAYESMNLSHAVAVALFAVTRLGQEVPEDERRGLSAEARDSLHARFEELLEALDTPAHKAKHLRPAFRRVMGRAMPSTWEFHRLMGVLGGAVKRIRRLEDRVRALEDAAGADEDAVEDGARGDRGSDGGG